MLATQLTTKGQVTVPKDVRDALRLAAGDKVFFVADGDRAIMVPLKHDIWSVHGALAKRARGKPFGWKRVRAAAERLAARRISALLRRAEEGEVEIRAADLTMAEVVWALGSYYEMGPVEVADVLEPLLDSPIQFENRDRLMVAMELFRAHKAGFGDCYLAAFERERKAEAVLSHDRNLSALVETRLEP